MKKSIIILAVIFCLSIIISAAAAFQAQQDQLPDISSFFNTESGTSGRSVQSITLNSIQFYGQDESGMQDVLDTLSGAKMEYSSQPGDTPRYSFELSLPDTQILTYSLQSGTPYYASSNFLGENTYMIYKEDEFEEKLVIAFYNLLEKITDDPSSLPDPDQLLAAIKAIKAGNVSVNMSASLAGFQGLSLPQEIDSSAFMEVIGDLMTRFTQAEATSGIGYRFTDFDPESLVFEWPAAENLPKIQASASAMTGTLYGGDLIKLLASLKQFLTDNPELTDTLNQTVIETMNQINPEMGIPEGADIVNELVSSLQESAQGIENYYLTIKIDNNEYGAPVLITIEIGQPSENGNQGIRMTIIPASDYPVSAVDVAIDMIAGEYDMPLVRSIFVSDSDNGSSGLNFLLAPAYDTRLEYVHHTNTTENVFGSRNTDTVIDYYYLAAPDTNYSGHASILKTAETNKFGGENESTQISYTHQSDGTPVFSVTFTADNKTEEELPILTPADAVRASDMTAEDYDDLAGIVFMQVMQIMINFM